MGERNTLDTHKLQALPESVWLELGHYELILTLQHSVRSIS